MDDEYHFSITFLRTNNKVMIIINFNTIIMSFVLYLLGIYIKVVCKAPNKERAHALCLLA